MNPDQLSVNQVLRLRIGDETYKGLIVNLTDDAMLVATTAKEAPRVANGEVITGEIFTADGVFNFAVRMQTLQMKPVMVVTLDRPRALRKVQRRREARYDVGFDGLFVFISADKSINAPVDVTNLSYGGAEVLCPDAPPLGLHAILLFRAHDEELSTIVRVVHVEPIEGGFRLGVAFVEMSRSDLEHLNQVVALLK